MSCPLKMRGVGSLSGAVSCAQNTPSNAVMLIANPRFIHPLQMKYDDLRACLLQILQ